MLIINFPGCVEVTFCPLCGPRLTSGLVVHHSEMPGHFLHAQLYHCLQKGHPTSPIWTFFYLTWLEAFSGLPKTVWLPTYLLHNIRNKAGHICSYRKYLLVVLISFSRLALLHQMNFFIEVITQNGTSCLYIPALTKSLHYQCQFFSICDIVLWFDYCFSKVAWPLW